MPTRKSQDQLIEHGTYEMPQLNLKSILLTLEGTAPLLMARMPDQIKDLDGVKKKKDAVPKPEEQAESNAYILDDTVKVGKVGRYGLKPGAFLKAFASTCNQKLLKDKSVSKALAPSIVRIGHGPGLVPIRFAHYEVRHDVGVNKNSSGGGVAVDLYRPMFTNWAIDLPITYDRDVITAEMVATVFQKAGFSIGVGAWRPQNSGLYGTFAVVNMISLD